LVGGSLELDYQSLRDFFIDKNKQKKNKTKQKNNTSHCWYHKGMGGLNGWHTLLPYCSLFSPPSLDLSREETKCFICRAEEARGLDAHFIWAAT